MLRYELEVCKEAMRQLNMCGDHFCGREETDELRTRYLVTPLALGGTQRRQQDNRPAEERTQTQRPQQPRQQPQTHQAESSQEAVGGQHEALTRSTRRTTASICFSFQNPKGCSRGQSCKHRHICAVTRTTSVPSTLNLVRQRLRSIRFARQVTQFCHQIPEGGNSGRTHCSHSLAPSVNKRASPEFPVDAK